jgi:hypothetical protein
LRDDGLEILLGIAKVNKFAVPGSGDGIEVMGRPAGGITAILTDGHGGGRSVSSISTMAAIKTAQLVADGVRDGSVARSVYDYFAAVQDGNFSIAMTMISADTESGNLIVCRNTNSLLMVRHEFGVDIYDEPAQSIGTHKNAKSVMIQRPLEEGLLVATFSDGLLNAGRKRGRSLDLKLLVRQLEESRPGDVQYLSESILDRAMALDSYQASDHMSVIVMGIDGKIPENKVECRTVRYAV